MANVCVYFGRTGDLRERHRRRCEKSIGKIIPTKKRSCERCISFKVKCDYEKPSCSRCLNRSVPCEYKLEPRVKMPLNPAFGLGPSPAFSGAMDVFSVQQSRAAERDAVMDQQDGASSVAASAAMSFDLSSSSASTDALDATTLDLVGPSFYTGNEYYQQWSHQDGSSNGQNSPWDATTVWSDGSSSIADPVMLDEAVMDPAWTPSMLDPTMCMDAYGEHSMAYYSPDMQQVQYHRPGKHHGKTTSLSY
ncbi:hypothetical protein ED733_003135 [Metarhizium rileyi]|uniref:Zn(2)-C6 fungal-type domain-containing protein n=1 Tax=Metarhizium rileyi (strain RCEF 4871) TaxID=1649241 RepID=A0A5C6FZQ2_METRR|nr:hypothetical protein ED733_003135 [Metarhizium rileyi]